MGIQNELPYGRTGWHGDNAVSLRSTLGEAETLVNDILASYQALLAEIDTQAGTTLVGDVTVDIVGVSGPVSVPAPATGSDKTLIHIAQGGSYTHGDNAVQLRRGLQDVQALVNEVKAKTNALLAVLDGGPGDGIDDGDYVAALTNSTPNMGEVHSRFANGGEAAHGDQGVALRLALQSMVVLANDLKTNHNALVAKINTDSTSGAYDPAHLVTADNIS